MRFIEWLLCTIQFLSPRAYFHIKKEQMRREEENECPIPNTWYNSIKWNLWSLWHRYRYEYWPSELVLSYDNLLNTLNIKSEEFSCASFKTPRMNIRLSGSTIVINEKWSINRFFVSAGRKGGKDGIYVHKMDQPDNWNMVYRTGWLMKDNEWMPLLDIASRWGAMLDPVVSPVIQNTNQVTTKAPVNGRTDFVVDPMSTD